MLGDPLANIRWINTLHLLRVEVGSSPMESKIGVGHDANVATRNIANEDRACGYARAHNSDLYPACGEGGPLRLIGAEKAALEVRDIDRFRVCGRCGERQNCNQQKLPDSHRPCSVQLDCSFYRSCSQGLCKAPASNQNQVAAHDDQMTARSVIEKDARA
jgi:hypothetical protein